ncbi:MAG: hypothetical protein ACLFS4_06805 [Opitutales bacterium]
MSEESYRLYSTVAMMTSSAATVAAVLISVITLKLKMRDNKPLTNTNATQATNQGNKVLGWMRFSLWVAGGLFLIGYALGPSLELTTKNMATMLLFAIWFLMQEIHETKSQAAAVDKHEKIRRSQGIPTAEDRPEKTA